MSERRPSDTATADEPGFLSRWSRRKREAAGDIEPAATVETAPAVAETQPAEPEPPPLTDADMPPVETLDEQSDYSGFFSPGVSEELRQLALRKLFRSAAFNVTDGLDDYADDFTSFEALGDIVTREMRVREAMDAAREKAKAALAETKTSRSPEQDAPDREPEEQPEPAAVAQRQDTPQEEASDEQPSQPA